MPFKFQKYAILSIILLLFSWNNCCIAQTINPKEIDSLLNEVSKADTSLKKIEIWAVLSKNYSYVEDYSNSKIYADLILNETKRNNNSIVFGFYNKAIADIEYTKLNFKVAQALYLKASNYFYKVKDYKNFATSRLNYSRIFNEFYKYNYAIANLLITFKIAKSKIPKEHKIIAELLRRLAFSQSKINQNDFAIKNLLNSTILFQKANDYSGIARNYYLLAEIYSKYSNLNKAIEYAEKAIETYYQHHLNDRILFVLANFTIADLYKKQGNYKKSEELSIKTLKFTSENKVTGYNFFLYYNLASVCYEQNNFKKALEYSDLALSNLKNDPVNLMSVYSLKANIYFESKNYLQAKTYFDKVIPFMESKEYKDMFEIEAQDIYRAASENEFQLKNFNQAYLLNLKYTEKSISALKNEKDKRIQGLLTKFEVQDKNNLITRNKNQIHKQQYQLRITLIISGIILVSVFVILFFYRKLKTKKDEIAHKNQELEESQNLLASSLHQKEILLREIHHRVKNNLQLVISLFNIQARKKNFDTLEDFLEKGENRIKSMSLIHEGLYQSNSLHQVDIKDYLTALIEGIKQTYDNEQQPKISTNIEVCSVYLNIETAVPLGLLLNEIITNTYKYAFPNDNSGTISIKISKISDSNFELIVADNGVGFNPDNLTQKSFGLDLINLLVKQLQGEIAVDTNNKTVYTINFTELKSKV